MDDRILRKETSTRYIKNRESEKDIYDNPKSERPSEGESQQQRRE